MFNINEVNLFKYLKLVWPLKSRITKRYLMPAALLLNWEILVSINMVTKTLKWSCSRQLWTKLKRTSKTNLSKGCEPSSTKSMKFVSKTCPVWLPEQNTFPLQFFHSHLRVCWKSSGRKLCHRCSHKDQSFSWYSGKLGPRIVVKNHSSNSQVVHPRS